MGKKITLKAEVIPSSVTLSGPKWNIPGEILANFIYKSTPPILTKVTKFDGETMEYYWVDGGDGREVSYSGEVNGLSVSATTTFDVKRPEANVTAKTGKAHVTGAVDHDYEENKDYPTIELLYGDPNSNKELEVGIYFTKTIKMPDGF